MTDIEVTLERFPIDKTTGHIEASAILDAMIQITSEEAFMDEFGGERNKDVEKATFKSLVQLMMWNTRVTYDENVQTLAHMVINKQAGPEALAPIIMENITKCMDNYRVWEDWAKGEPDDKRTKLLMLIGWMVHSAIRSLADTLAHYVLGVVPAGYKPDGQVN